MLRLNDIVEEKGVKKGGTEDEEYKRNEIEI